jgi:2,4-dienoyl-CoA reductase-like NADH-dependent reductase (Old Yellow Enzyme family)
MKYIPPNKFATAEAFDAHLRSFDASIGLDARNLGASGPLAQAVNVSGRTLSNRFAVHPMEGWDGTPDGAPTEHTLRRWRRFGESGAKLIWGGEAFAVQRDGRANANQLYFNRSSDTERHLAALLAALHEGHRKLGESPDGLFAGLQLTHSGRFARPDDHTLKPRMAQHNPALDEKYGIDPALPVLTDAELESIGESFVAAARVAQNVGFDFVDVKCCHGYLLHGLLSARDRPGLYGGSFDNRTRLFTQIVHGIGSECPGLEIGVRVSVTDLYPFSSRDEDHVGCPKGMERHLPYLSGFGIDPNNPLRPDWDEPIRFLKLIKSLGISLVNVTVGSPYYCPHLQRPAAFPPSDGYLPPEDPLLSVIAHLQAVRMCKAAVPELLLVGSGYSYLQEFLPYVAQHEVGRGHVDFVGLGRMVLAYPNLPADFLSGKPLARKRICRTFSDCTTAPRNQMISGCYPLDDYYKSMPHAQEVRSLRPSTSR